MSYHSFKIAFFLHSPFNSLIMWEIQVSLKPHFLNRSECINILNIWAKNGFFFFLIDLHGNTALFVWNIYLSLQSVCSQLMKNVCRKKFTTVSQGFVLREFSFAIQGVNHSKKSRSLIQKISKNHKNSKKSQKSFDLVHFFGSDCKQLIAIANFL